jgi:hypothetical protein
MRCSSLRLFAEFESYELVAVLPEDDDECEATEEGGGRYKKSYYGVNVNFTAKCSCGKEDSAVYQFSSGRSPQSKEGNQG